MGLLRAAAVTLAPDVAELDVVAELHIDPGASLAPVVEALEVARARGHRGALDVVVLATPATEDAPATPARSRSARDAGWTKDVAPPDPATRPAGLPPRR